MSPSPTTPRIRTLRLVSSGAVEVVMDDDRTFRIPLGVMEEERLSVGDPVDAHLEARLLEAESRSRLRTAALSLLSVRARSRSELATRLRRKDYPARWIAECLDELEAAGWVDDAAFARALARDRLRLRPRGPGRMIQELRAKGVAEDVAREAVEAVFAEEDVAIQALADEVARGWFRRQGAGIRAALLADTASPDRDRARRRLHAFLARRGFTGAVARAALESLTERPEGD